MSSDSVMDETSPTCATSCASQVQLDDGNRTRAKSALTDRRFRTSNRPTFMRGNDRHARHQPASPQPLYRLFTRSAYRGSRKKLRSASAPCDQIARSVSFVSSSRIASAMLRCHRDRPVGLPPRNLGRGSQIRGDHRRAEQHAFEDGQGPNPSLKGGEHGCLGAADNARQQGEWAYSSFRTRSRVKVRLPFCSTY